MEKGPLNRCECVYYTILHDLTVLHTHRRIGNRAFSVAQRRINLSANYAMARGPQSPAPLNPVWMHFGIGAGIRYYTVRLLRTYVFYANSPVMTSTKLDNKPATGLFAY